MKLALKEERPELKASAVVPRTRVSIPIVISGTDSNGHPFEEESRTVEVTNRGMLIETLRPLSLGAEISIENRTLERRTTGRVVWRTRDYSLMRANEFGIFLPDAEVFCGLLLTLRTAAVDGDSLLQQDTAQPRANGLAEVSQSEDVPSAVVEQERAAPKPGETVELTVTAASTDFEKRLDEIQSQMILRAQTSLQESAAGLEDRVLVSMRQQAGSLEERLQTSRAQAETMLAQLEELQKRTQGSLEQSAANLEEETLASLQRRVAPLTHGLQKSRTEVELMLDDLKEIEQRTQRSIEDSASRLEQTAVASIERQLGLVDERLQSFHTQVEGALAKLGEARQASELEVARFRETIPELSGQAAQFAVESLNERLHAEMGSFAATFAEEARAGFRRDAGAAIQALLGGPDLKASLQGLLENQSATVFAGVRREIEESNQRMLSEMQQRSEQIVQAACDVLNQRVSQAGESLNDLSRQAAGSVEACAQKIESNAKRSGEAFQGRVDTIADVVADRLRASSEALVNSLTERLQAAALETQSRSREAVQAGLEKVTQELVERSTAQLRQSAQEALGAAAEELAQKQKLLMDQAVETLGQSFNRLVESAGSRMHQTVESHLELVDEKLVLKQQAFLREATRGFRDKIGEILLRLQGPDEDSPAPVPPWEEQPTTIDSVLPEIPLERVEASSEAAPDVDPRSGAERRREPRLELTVPILVTGPTGESEQTETADLSKSGLRFRTRLNLAVGDSVKLVLGYGLRASPPCRNGVVAWEKPDADGQQTYGIRFSESPWQIEPVSVPGTDETV